MAAWIWLLVTVALALSSSAIWWIFIRGAIERVRPLGIYERVAELLAREVQPVEDDRRAALAAQADREFRVALHERGIVPDALRLELRDDDLLGLVPWVIHPDGRAEALSAYEAGLRRAPASPDAGVAPRDASNPYDPPHR